MQKNENRFISCSPAIYNGHSKWIKDLRPKTMKLPEANIRKMIENNGMGKVFQIRPQNHRQQKQK
jgi:hypothetical protein